MKKTSILSGIVGSVILLSACSWFSSSDSTQNTTAQQSSSSSTATASQSDSESSKIAEGGGSSNSGSTGSGDAAGSGRNNSQKSKGRVISKELANGLLESAKQGKLTDCEFAIGTKLQEVISKWGDPQDGDVSVAIYRSKRCSFYTNYNETTIPVDPVPAPKNEEISSQNDETGEEKGAENGAEDGKENVVAEPTEGTEQGEQNGQLETSIEEDTIDDLSKLDIVAIVSSDAKYRNISVESVKQALGKPTKEQRRKLIYQAGSYTLEFTLNKDGLTTSVVVAE